MKSLMDSMEKARTLSEVALGNLPPQTVFKNGTVFNAFTAEFIPHQSVWIKDGWIAYVGPDQDPPNSETTETFDVEGMVLLPGLIEGHTHLSMALVEIDEFIKCIIPSGTTTVVAETIELGTICGRKGIEYFVQGFRDQPIRFYYTIPALCGLTASEESKAPPNEELLPFLKDQRCLGLGEVYWSNMLIEGEQGKRVRELAALSLDLGKRVEGHSAGASGKKLQAYTCFGVSSCHEPITASEVLERLRLGYWVMIREGSIRKELPGIIDIFRQKIDFRRLILSTDGMDPSELLEEGFLDAALRTALRLGVPPNLAYQMVTLNVAEHFRLDDQVGSLSPGKMADVVVIPEPGVFSPRLVMVGGQVIFQDGRIKIPPRKAEVDQSLLQTIRLDAYTVSSPSKRGKVRVMELISDLVTQERILDLEDPEASEDVIMVLALDRLGSGKAFLGFLKGFGLRKGALGLTLSWDSGDLVVAGCDRLSMSRALGRLREIGGGVVFAIEDQTVSELPAPIGGALSRKPIATVREEMKSLYDSLRRFGAKGEKPVLTISTLTTAAIPHLRITHNGYVRLKDRKILSIEP